MSDRAMKTIQRRILLGTLLFAILLILGYLVFVYPPLGHQFDDDAYLGRGALSQKVVRLDSQILDLVSKASLVLAAIVLFLIAAVRRCALVGAITVAAFGCAVVGAEVIKGLLPWRALVRDDTLLTNGLEANNSYPSGHATVGTSLALSLLLVSPSRWRPWLAVAAGCLSAAYATSVLFTGWHRPSDALGALAWSGFCMSLAAALAVRLRGRIKAAIAHPGRAILGSTGLAILVATATWVIAARAAADYPFVDLPFLVLSELIIGGAFALTAWYAWQLRGVDWSSRPVSYRGLE
jgi:membrane-associated phospholipid phosphatase